MLVQLQVAKLDDISLDLTKSRLVISVGSLEIPGIVVSLEATRAPVVSLEATRAPVVSLVIPRCPSSHS